MRAILEFDFDNPEDEMAHLRCVKSTNMALVLFEVIYNYRKRIEYAELKEGQSELDYFYEMFHAELDQQGINIDELIR